MGGMYGADVAQLRQLAGQFDRFAGDLDADRLTVGNAIQISAWAGPVAVRFRHEWDSAHSRKVADAAARLREAARRLRSNADDQERASAVDGGPGVSGLGPLPAFPGFDFRMPGLEWGTIDVADGASDQERWAKLIEYVTQDVLIDGADWVSTHIDHAGMWIDQIAGTKNFDVLELVPGGSYLDSVFKGIGLGDAAARFAEAIQNRDWSGAMVAGVDGVAGFVPNPVGFLWDGMKEMTGFYIPLDEAARDEHFAWMDQQGYTPEQVSDRYEGVQGFINLGNDNVERKAPWLNDIADTVMQKPAELLFNMGIKLY